MSDHIRLDPETNAELEEAVRLFMRFGYRAEVRRLEELIDRRKAMGYDPEPVADPEREAERERRRKLASDYAESLKQETPTERKPDHEPKEKRTKRRRA